MRDAQATRQRLLLAARKAFSDRGFERTTVREIADDANANPALINRYFGGKEQLFAEAVAIDLALPDLSKVEKASMGRALIAHFFHKWEGSEQDDLLRTLIRAAATHEVAASRVRAILTDQVQVMVERVAGQHRAHERACLIATQILGLAYARYVIGLSNEDLPRDTIAGMVGDTIQRYLCVELP
ncbi:TetR family transcriptional regulator [Lysobacter auxotrophicus]|uniref:TetR family transcriptional regulator n=1 Tax=Lysobacter auxotrophicus TaxID=2992573 RepID=A0ABM8DHU2_9GAMM|nr:TetR family transcriptional regulator [Lysobacter auxotrophicus]BDU18130.1 TetR family transcriptional regulator [Lysobacter auxotrophicus]